MASPESSHNDDVPSEDEGLDETEWEQVGFNNKSMITRQASFSESPVSEIFRGEMLSIVQKQGSKESATVQPFFALPLDIQGEGVETVAQALERHGAKETLSDMKCSKTNTEVEASRKISLSRLPPIFILHLKRFSFNDKGSQKLCKPVDYEMELEIPRELLAPHLRKSPVDQRKYHLTAVVYHHGISSTGGHYTCDVLLPHCGGWINADDSNLCTLSEDKVLKGQNKEKHKVAYLLCYRRADLMP
jgi:ubiquitin carboxyl-terminal hydrolase 10